VKGDVSEKGLHMEDMLWLELHFTAKAFDAADEDVLLNK
jgi:hypothetical protein